MNVMTNQVDQMYVLVGQPKAVGTGATLVTPGESEIGVTKRGEVYLKHLGATKELTRTDLIKEGQVTEIKVTDAVAMRTNLHTTTVTLDGTINGGQPIPGEDYELKITISQFQDIAEDSEYFKYGFVHAVAGMSDSDFYKIMALSLAKNFSREISKLFEFAVKTAGGETVVTAATKLADLTGVTATGIIIKELAQDSHLSAYQPVEGVNYHVTCDEITYNGEDVAWGTAVTAEDPARFIKNGAAISDMEYFFHGERGDQYRIFDAPLNRIVTKYMVDESKEYDVVNIHYYFVDSLGGAQKSEKDMTLVIEHGAASDGAGAGEGEQVATAIATELGIGASVVVVKGDKSIA